MDLATGCPFWPLQDGILHAYPSLQQNVSCQAAIVGAGVTGALAAYHLAKEGVDVVVIDKRDVGTGSTGACTGLLQYEIDTPLRLLSKRIGKEAARRAYLISYRTIDELEDLIRELGDDCGFAHRQSLYLASRKSDVTGIRAECDIRREIGIEVNLLDATSLMDRFGVRAPAALLSAKAGEVDAFRLTHKLLRTGTERFNARVFARTDVHEVQPSSRRIVLTTSSGFKVKAERVLFATGYETQRYLRSRRVKLKTTYATVSEPDPEAGGPSNRPILWETARPYFYTRSGPDGRMMIGGGDDDFTAPARRAAALGKKVRFLARRYAKTYPSAPPFRPAFSWAGVFGESDDGLPFIGACGEGGMSRAYYAVGYGGNGVTFSLVAAQIMRDTFLNRENPDGALFCFDR